MQHSGYDEAGPAVADNEILAALPVDEMAVLGPHLKRVELTRGMVLAEAGDAIDTVYFPLRAVASLVVGLSGGQMIEAGLVGRTGMLGGSCALGSRRALVRWVVQVPGISFALPSDRFRSVAVEQPEVLLAAGRHEQFLLAHAQQSCACSAVHGVEARLATWLLRCHDLLTSEDIPMTQEFLAEMLGLQRTTVSIAATALQRGGVIHYRRGHIRISDRAGLHRMACECYDAVNTQRLRIFGADTAPS